MPKLTARPRPTPTTGPWQRASFRGELSAERLSIPAGNVTLEVEGARWDHVDVGGLRIANYVARGALLTDCSFVRCTIEAGVLGHLPMVVYRDCDFERADLHGCSPMFARFERCRFVDTNLVDWRAVDAEFVGCVFTGRLLRVRFSGTPLGAGREALRRIRTHNDFRDNDFSGADLVDCSITGGVDLDSNRWPQSSDYVIIRSAHERIAAAREQLSALPEDVRMRAKGRLDMYSLLFGSQRDILAKRSELGPLVSLLLPG